MFTNKTKTMKKTTTHISALIISAIILTSCGGTKEIIIPCNEKGRSDAQFFRAAGSAKSRDMASAKDKALISTKQILASLIGSTMKSVTDNYLSQASSDVSNSQKFETITREIVNQQLKYIVISCEKTQKGKDGYETFLSLEMPKTAVIQSFVERVNNEPSLKANFNEAEFKKIADQELSK